jgi:hypothetical protein
MTAVLKERFWRRRFGEEKGLIGIGFTDCERRIERVNK